MSEIKPAGSFLSSSSGMGAALHKRKRRAVVSAADIGSAFLSAVSTLFLARALSAV